MDWGGREFWMGHSTRSPGPPGPDNSLAVDGAKCTSELARAVSEAKRRRALGPHILRPLELVTARERLTDQLQAELAEWDRAIDAHLDALRSFHRALNGNSDWEAQEEADELLTEIACVRRERAYGPRCIRVKVLAPGTDFCSFEVESPGRLELANAVVKALQTHCPR